MSKILNLINSNFIDGFYPTIYFDATKNKYLFFILRNMTWQKYECDLTDLYLYTQQTDKINLYECGPSKISVIQNNLDIFPQLTNIPNSLLRYSFPIDTLPEPNITLYPDNTGFTFYDFTNIPPGIERYINVEIGQNLNNYTWVPYRLKITSSPVNIGFVNLFLEFPIKFLGTIKIWYEFIYNNETYKSLTYETDLLSFNIFGDPFTNVKIIDMAYYDISNDRITYNFFSTHNRSDSFNNLSVNAVPYYDMSNDRITYNFFSTYNRSDSFNNLSVNAVPYYDMSNDRITYVNAYSFI